MRLLIHDYSGHPFQVQLSRALAARGHVVRHVHFQDFQTPKGPLERQNDDPAGFSVTGLSLGEAFQKYNFIKRRQQEIAYGRLLADCVLDFQPDIFVSSNAPLDVQRTVLNLLKHSEITTVHWLQDIYSEAITGHFSGRYLGLGSLIAGLYRRMEAQCLKTADGVILISEDFNDNAMVAALPQNRVTTIRNWANTSDIKTMDKDNAWSRRHGLQDNFLFTYSGTLGLKHNPNLLVQLAEAFRAAAEVKILVISEGLGADWLQTEKAARSLDNLTLLPFQDYADLGKVLSAADVLVSLLEPQAGRYSVPSKTLSYLAAGRPQLMAVPDENLAAGIVTRDSQSGLAASPDDTAAFLDQAQRLYSDPHLRQECCGNARRYALQHFDIDQITDRFETFFHACRNS